MLADDLLGGNQHIRQNANLFGGAVINDIGNFLLERLNGMIQIIAQKAFRGNMQRIGDADQGLNAQFGCAALNMGDVGGYKAYHFRQSLLRELLFKTKRYMQDKADGKNPGFDMKLEAMIPVLEGKIPLKAHAHRADDILSSIRVAKEFGINLMNAALAAARSLR